MADIQNSDKSAFVEETGLFFESLGMTRMSGRILGYMMIADKEMVSFDDLTRELQASKSSISTNVKACINTQFIKPITSPGDRKTYYILSPDISWVDIVTRKTQQLIHLKSIFERGLNLRKNKKDKPSEWLENASDFYGWMIIEFPNILSKWNEYKQNKK